ncbi:zinc finger HIT domain-containing protein 3 [Monomorium pharaonis]|uniref:zinc finger HIT domain-containing protein 3 n=1 Tax=Monomorium pharaonis TaxID=307658 RepID=UPI001747D4C9|nr:zinc finger HIT domain-containing protein 3 [Monomorium pharaonis]
MPIKTCCVCGKDGASYKCPTCRAPYCSIGCCKEHKVQPCKPSVLSERAKESQISERKYEFPTEDTVPVEKLQQLRNSKELIKCLENPHLHDIMKAVVNSPDPTEMIALAMKEPIFVEMANACLKVVEPSDDDRPY